MDIIECLIRNRDLITLTIPRPGTKRLSPNLPIIMDLGYKSFINNEQYNTVLWCEYFISSNNIQEKGDSVSFRFSGCLMARYKFHEKYFIDHIHVGEGNYNIFEQWKNLSKHYEEIILFRPTCNFDSLYIERMNNLEKNEFYLLEKWGIIDVSGNCYSIYLSKKNGFYKLYGIYQHIDKCYFSHEDISNCTVDDFKNPETEIVYTRQ